MLLQYCIERLNDSSINCDSLCRYFSGTNIIPHKYKAESTFYIYIYISSPLSAMLLCCGGIYKYFITNLLLMIVINLGHMPSFEIYDINGDRYLYIMTLTVEDCKCSLDHVMSLELNKSCYMTCPLCRTIANNIFYPYHNCCIIINLLQAYHNLKYSLKIKTNFQQNHHGS